MNAGRRSVAVYSVSPHTAIASLRARLLVAALFGAVAGCSSPGSTTGDDGSGGSTASGGRSGSGGTGSGGSASGSGGKTAATGGVSGGSGGASPSATGGSASSGGAHGTGGIAASGGVTAAGGAAVASGGAAGNGAGGKLAASGGAAGAPASAGGGPGTGSTAVENQSADCTVGALPDASALPKITKLPDPFMKLDGTRVASKADWHCRRQEIRKQAETYILGAKPTPDMVKVTGTVTSSKISVHVDAPSKSIDFSATVVLPTKGQAPFPVLINVGTSGSLTLGESRILDQGVAVIYYNNYDLGKEGTAQASRGKPNAGMYYDIYGSKDPAGLLTAWAWGASRLVDVLEQSGGSMFDLTGIGVTGCSRFGKGAFIIGVFDDRIALTIPQEPSTGGDPALRIMDVLPGAERTDYNYNGLNWLSDNFAPFVYANNTSNAVKLPIDMHALVAMIAPRGLLVLENPHQTQMGAPAGYMSTMAGLQVYKALGVEKNVSYHSDVADTAHCSYKTEYTDLLAQSITAFLKHSGDPPGQIKVGSGGSLTQSDWIDWQAPTLP